MTSNYKVSVEALDDLDKGLAAEIQIVLQSITDTFMNGRREPNATVQGYGLHIRGCQCGNCDGSGGIPGGLIYTYGYYTGETGK
jgi:hypothetical protein